MAKLPLQSGNVTIENWQFRIAVSSTGNNYTIICCVQISFLLLLENRHLRLLYLLFPIPTADQLILQIPNTQSSPLNYTAVKHQLASQQSEL